MKRFLLLNVFFCFLFFSCEDYFIAEESRINSIKFISDNTIEYHFIKLSNKKDYVYKIQEVEVTALDGGEYSMIENPVTGLIGKIIFNKDIPDGSTINIIFMTNVDYYVEELSLKK